MRVLALAVALLIAGVVLLNLAIANERERAETAIAERDELRLELTRLLRESCEVTEGGPRVLCAVRDGRVLRQELGEHDFVVRARLRRRG